MSREYKSFIDIFKYAKRSYPEKTAIVVGERSRSYGELYDRAELIAGYLRGRGIKPSEHVAIVSQNSLDYVETVLGCIMCGAIVVKINWRLAPPELHHLLTFNEAKLVFYRSQDRAVLDEIAKLLRESPLGASAVNMDRMDEVLQGIEPLHEYYERRDDEVLMHLHTSGTSGFPKTVRYLNGEYMKELTDCVHSLHFDQHTVFQLMSQMFHSASIGPYSTLASGGTVVLFPKFLPQEYLASVQKNHVTNLSAITTVLTAILNQPNLDDFDLSSVETISYSACPMPPDLVRRAIDRMHCGFLQSYGMTEMGSIVTVLTPGDHMRDNMRRLASVGRPIEGHKVKIVDENRRDCAPGLTGEIAVRGSGMMLDYYKMPEETKAAISDGWYYTGDMGFLDDEGYLFISGRKSDMIISGGENIFPSEVENVLQRHDGIAEVCVVGVPDEYWGESVQAFVIPREGFVLDQDEVRSFCRGKIAGYKIPKKVHFVSEFPRTATGKVEKKSLLEEFL